jgi:hypothetical protein
MTRQGVRIIMKKLIEEDKIRLVSIEKFGNRKYRLR